MGLPPTVLAQVNPVAPKTSSLSGTKEKPKKPKIKIENTVIGFGTVCAGLTVPKTIVIKNTGEAPLKVTLNTDLQIGGNFTFGYLGEKMKQLSIAPGSQEWVRVYFKPSAMGTAAATPTEEVPGAALYEGSITVNHNDPVANSIDIGRKIHLTGVGLDPNLADKGLRQLICGY